MKLARKRTMKPTPHRVSAPFAHSQVCGANWRPNRVTKPVNIGNRAFNAGRQKAGEDKVVTRFINLPVIKS